MSRPYDYAGTPGGGSYYSVNNAENSQQPIYSPAHHNDSSALLANGGSGSGGAYPPGGAPVPKPYGSNGAKPWYKKPAVLWTAAIILVVAIAAGVGGGVAGSKSDDKSSGDTKGQSGNAADSPAAAGTDANGNPVYTATASAAAPTATGNLLAACATSTPTYTTTPGGLQVRTDHPRLFADQAKWDCLPSLIEKDAYLRKWNDIILANASRYADMDPVQYTPDGGLGGSGVLDIARELQLRTKHWAYAWRMTKDQKWVARTWTELQVASGNSAQSFGADGTRWNPLHFLDTAEFTAAFAYSYDWMYDAWSPDQRNSIRDWLITLGLSLGLRSYTDTSVGYGWWQESSGNWNNVCNGGLTLGALAVLTEDTTGTAAQLLSNTIANIRENGVAAVSSDGTWSETSDYWYFGNHGISTMVGALQTATGSDQGILDANPAFNLTGWFHIYGTGFVQKFNYGDCGPNKFVATANALFLYGNHFNLPRYPLYQRDREDAADPLSMLWYNPDLSGDWWYNLALDRYFPNGHDAWASMRSSWTEGKGLYAAIKAGDAMAHQDHGNLDAGTFVLEAMGQRFAGELCHSDYLSPEYFKSEAQDAMRWTYYRCMTEGQNTLSFNGQNQLVGQTPRTVYASTGDQQQGLDSPAPANSAVFFWTDLSGTYGSDAATAVRRGMRLYNQRRQVLIRDEIEGAQTAGQWRMHTNATITYSNNNRVATLSLGGETLTATILDSAPDVSFQTLPATRTANAPRLGTSPEGAAYDLPNPGVSVLAIDIPTGATTLEVLFNPQWEGLSASDYKTPPSVPLSGWSVTSHP